MKALFGFIVLAVLGSSVRGDAHEALNQPEARPWNRSFLNIEVERDIRICHVSLSQIENKSRLVVAFCKGELVIDNSHKRREISHSHLLGRIQRV